MPVTVKGSLVCEECCERTDVDLQVAEFGHDKDCLFVKEPREYDLDNGWAYVRELDYGKDNYVWLCPQHWRETKGWPGRERKS